MRSTPGANAYSIPFLSERIKLGELEPSVEGAPSSTLLPVAGGSASDDQTSRGRSLVCSGSSMAFAVQCDETTEGLGGKAEKAIEAADRVRDVDRIAEKSARVASHAEGSISEASRLVRPASSAKQKEQLGEHLRQHRKYGTPEQLPDGRWRYKGDVKPARATGEMYGQRVVREWNPETGQSRTWQETLDHEGRIRQVRPDESLTGGRKVHYKFDPDGRYQGAW